MHRTHRNKSWCNTVKQKLRKIHFKKKTKADSYILQNEDELYKWAHIEIDPVNNEIKTDNIKSEEKVKTKQDSSRE